MKNFKLSWNRVLMLLFILGAPTLAVIHAVKQSKKTQEQTLALVETMLDEDGPTANLTYQWVKVWDWTVVAYVNVKHESNAIPDNNQVVTLLNESRLWLDDGLEPSEDQMAQNMAAQIDTMVNDNNYKVVSVTYAPNRNYSTFEKRTIVPEPEPEKPFPGDKEARNDE